MLNCLPFNPNSVTRDRARAEGSARGHRSALSPSASGFGLKQSAVFAFVLAMVLALVLGARAQVRDGGIDPKNLGKGVWIYYIGDATNKVGGHVGSVTNVNSLMQYFRSAGMRYCMVKMGTSDRFFPGPASNNCQLTSNFINTAHSNGIAVFGYNRSYGSNIVGEVSLADYCFNQGADGFVFDAEAEWESGRSWITNGPAQAWQLCSTVRSNWPNKFLAHAPFPIIYLHSSFPYKEFGFWCDAVMPQIYHFSTAGIKDSPSAAINWSDVNWSAWQSSLYALPLTNITGVAVNWTNAIKPIIPLQDVYGEVVPGGNPNGGAATEVYPDEDVLEFVDYVAADPHAQTAGGYRGVNFWRADTIGTNQWANVSAGTSGTYSNIVNNLVLDDASATVVGGWTSVRVFGATTTAATYYGATGTDTNSFGTNYLFKGQGSGAAFVQFTPNIVIPGNYDLYQWHPFLTNASAGVPFVIGTPAGTNLAYANQQTNSGNWSLVGRFNFAAGNSNYIRVLDNFSDAANIAAVDGVKLVYADADIILDNTDPQVSCSGGWISSSSGSDRYLTNYYYASSGTGVTATATFRPSFPNPGFYDVFVWHSVSGNRATNAPWTLSSFGSSNVWVNQQINGGGWFKIASARPFSAGTNGWVRLANNAGPSVVIADAVKFSFAGPLSPLTLSAIRRQADGRVTLTVNSTPGYGVWLERATNLLGAWLPLTNLLNPSGTLSFTDQSASNNLNAGFYRARQ